MDDTAYTYAYVNKTVTATIGRADGGRYPPAIPKATAPSSMAAQFTTDVPGYTKQNAYRIWGNIFRACPTISISAG